MVSQHPDHAGVPYWHNSAFIQTGHESHECFLSYSDLGVDEYKWDWEGKFVDESVVERLLSEHFEYFQTNPLGKNKFLTFRLPNPKVETEFRLGRAFMGILTAERLATQIGLHSPPLFEVILPMTETSTEMIDIQEAFHEVASLKHKTLQLGNERFKHIGIIPLFEQVEVIINSDKLLTEYFAVHKKKFKFLPPYMRPYLARSDPALNAGIVPTVLAIKIALSRYKSLEQRTGIGLFPIIGSASLPFRGGLSPHTVKNFIREYKGIKTALLQSAFRYDFDHDSIQSAIAQLEKNLPNLEPETIQPKEEQVLLKSFALFSNPYTETVEGIAPIINAIASQLPARRERVQHVGLFGYSRGVGAVKLPRAIGFTAALYSLGVPPEFIGTGRGLKQAANLGYLPIIEKYYVNLKHDLIRAGQYLNKNNLIKLAKKQSQWKGILDDVTYIERYLKQELSPLTEDQKIHLKITQSIYARLTDGTDFKEEIIHAAILRKSLG